MVVRLYNLCTVRCGFGAHARAVLGAVSESTSGLSKVEPYILQLWLKEVVTITINTNTCPLAEQSPRYFDMIRCTELR